MCRLSFSAPCRCAASDEIHAEPHLSVGGAYSLALSPHGYSTLQECGFRLARIHKALQSIVQLPCPMSLQNRLIVITILSTCLPHHVVVDRSSTRFRCPGLGGCLQSKF